MPTTYIGTDAADTINALKGGGVIQGLGGDDVLIVNSNGTFTLEGGEGNDALYAGLFNDSLSGGPGADFLDAGGGQDTLAGGDGPDVFNWAPSRTGDTTHFCPVIVDWSSEDRLSFGNGSLTGGGYVENTGTNPDDAALAADVAIQQGGARYVVTAIGPDLYVFANSTSTGGGPYSGSYHNEVVMIRGRTLADISADNFVSAAQGQTYSGTAGADFIKGDRGPGVIQGLDGADTLVAISNGDFTLQGGAGNDHVFGGDGLDSVSGGDGDDLIEGGLGQDTLAGGAGSDIFAWGAGEAGPNVAGPDTIIDWSPEDHLSFASGGVQGPTYLETTAASVDAARTAANSAIGDGTANFVVVAVGADLYLFVDGLNNNGQADDVVLIRGRTLGDIDIANFASTSAVVGLPPPTTPAITGHVRIEGDMDLVHPGDLARAVVNGASDLYVDIGTGSVQAIVSGSGFTYVNNQLVGGAANALQYIVNAGGQALLNLSVTGASFSAASLGGWVATNDGQGALSTVLAGNDDITGSDATSIGNFSRSGGDVIHGFGGDDVIHGFGGPDTLFGGTGNDQILALGGGNSAPAVGTYLRGEEGNDYIVGGPGFDDINGNQGNDTASGGVGDDWVVGGKDGDLLFGDAGADLVYGNLGDDTCQGGDGNDIVRGGQGNDLVLGDAGDDFVSGDKGDDTVAGGLGADIFHTFGDAGIDRVTDFNIMQGDRVMLDPGTQYSLAQVGADTVISMTGGGQMILVNVQLSTLPTGWLFGA